MAAIVNVTPHSISIHGEAGVVVIEPSGIVARVAATSSVVERIGDIPVYETTYGEIEGLPAPVDGTVFVASMLVASRAVAAGRTDVYSPGTLIRGEDGQPVGCKGLSRPQG